MGRFILCVRYSLHIIQFQQLIPIFKKRTVWHGKGIVSLHNATTTYIYPRARKQWLTYVMTGTTSTAMVSFACIMMANSITMKYDIDIGAGPRRRRTFCANIMRLWIL